MRQDLTHHYDELGIEPGASLDEVKRAYRDLATVWHPDRFANNPRLQQKANEQLKAINAAYQVISTELAQHERRGNDHVRQDAEKKAQDSDARQTETDQAQEQTTREYTAPSDPSEPPQKWTFTARHLVVGLAVLLLLIGLQAQEPISIIAALVFLWLSQ